LYRVIHSKRRRLHSESEEEDEGDLAIPLTAEGDQANPTQAKVGEEEQPITLDSEDEEATAPPPLTPRGTATRTMNTTPQQSIGIMALLDAK